MNKDLQRFMSRFYRQSIQPKNSDRGFSSYDGTQYLRDNIIKLFEKHSIQSVFDEYTTQFPVYQINWSIEPWIFPQPVDCANEMPGGNGRVLGLWHRDQIINLL